jgi:ATP-dependent helicase/nuclease subunit A
VGGVSTAPAYEHNGHAVSREGFYAIACDPQRSVAVEACAGAGKTWMLVSRIVRALLAGCPPHDILAITFTKKAAGEMRQRLHEWLSAFALADDATLAQELKIRGISDIFGRGPAPDLIPLLRNLQQSVLAQGRPVQIRTFHSWFAALLRSAPLAVLQELQLPTSYELLEDDAKAVALVWRRFHTALAAGENLRQERADFHAVVAVHGRFQTEKALSAALAKRVEFALADAARVVDASVQPFGALYPEGAGLDDPTALFHQAACRQALQAAASALGRANAPTFSAKGSALEQALAAGDFDAACASLLTTTGTPRKFGEKIVGIEQVRLAQELLLRIAAAQAQHEAWLYQQRMARLTRVLIAEFSALKREQGWVDMNDVENAALTLLTNPVLSGWVQERLDTRIRHLLIDEFQDTNPLQWQALSGWLQSYAGAGSTAPSVFIVGDPKQSIYRFRRAEPQVFIAAQDFVREGLGGDLLSCDHTRRNALQVTATVNTVMQQAQQGGEYQGFRQHSTESTQAGQVLALPQIAREQTEAQAARDATLWRDSLTTPREVPEETLRTLECRQAAHWIAAQLAAGLQPQDVMVLARKRDRLAVLQEELQALQIPTQQPEKNDLADAPEVQDMVALLDVLVSPAHDLSLAQALKSPLFGVLDAELVTLALAQRRAAANGNRQCWFDLLQTAEDLPPRLKNTVPTLLRWQAWLAAWPPHDALDAIFHDGDVLARFAAAAPAAQRVAVLANLRALLGAALSLDGARYTTPYAFVRALKAGGVRAPSRADANAVRLLTVHGAKGLEAPLVLLLDCDAPAPRAETMGLLVDWPGEAAAPQRFVFLASETHPPACAADVLETEKTARAREELNALYVAMTRAQSQLVLSSIAPHRASETSWWQRVGPQAQAQPVPSVPVPQAPRIADTLQTPFFIKILPKAGVDIGVSAIESAAPTEPASVESRIGLAMHRLLEWAPLSASPVLQWPAEQLRRAAREFDLTPPQAERAQAIALRIRNGAAAWAWDPARIDWQGNEVELVQQGTLLRLDRLVRQRDGAQWWVLDYKSHSRPQAQAALVVQMQGYRSAVQAIYPGQTVRVALLTGEGALVEIDAKNAAE